MARQIGPDQAERVFYITTGSRKGTIVPAGTPVPLYSDIQCTLPADVLALDGSAIAGTIPTVLTGDTLEAALFQFPDVPDPIVYTRVLGGPVVALHPRTDDRVDALRTRLDALEPGGSAEAATAEDLFSVRSSGQQLAEASNVTVADEGSNPRPLEYFGGYLWGTGSAGQIYRSSDAGTNWAQVGTAPVRLQRLALASDGEMIGVGPTAVYRSSGWASNSLTATWSSRTTVSPGTSQYQEFGFDGQGLKFILTEYASGVRADSRWVKITLDGGATWSTAWDTNVQFPATFAESHLHGCCYDPWEDRFWFSEGHGTPKGLYYSDNDGATWTRLTGGVADTLEPLPTVLVATDDGIVCGTDSATYGVYGIRRTTDPADMQLQPLWRWQAAKDGVIGFGARGWRDPRDGVVYIGYYVGVAGVFPIVTAGTASGATKVWTAPDGGVESRVWGAWVTADDVFVARTATASNTTQRKATGVIRRPGAGSASMADAGNALTGDAVGMNSSVAIGGGASTGAFQQSVAIGNLAAASSAVDGKGVAVGYTAVALDRAVAVGDRATTTAVDAVAVGSISTAGVNATAVGQDSEASGSGSTAIGKGAVSSGSNAITLGQLSTASGADTTAIGVQASVTGASALGVGRAVTVAGDNSTAVGRAANCAAAEGVALGRNASVTPIQGTAVGHGATVVGSQGTAVGNGASVASGHTQSVAIGLGQVTTAAAQVRLGAKHVELTELAADPAAPAADGARWYVKDNGSGKSQLCVRFATGAVVVIATEP